MAKIFQVSLKESASRHFKGVCATTLKTFSPLVGREPRIFLFFEVSRSPLHQKARSEYFCKYSSVNPKKLNEIKLDQL
jgi:hypothetical protein